MAKQKGTVRFGAYVEVLKGRGENERVDIHEISFRLPMDAEHTDMVTLAAESKARATWKNCWVVETWMYPLR